MATGWWQEKEDRRELWMKAHEDPTHKYEFAVSNVNAYYRSILQMSNKRWPDGLRRLHGEDEDETATGESSH